MKFYVANQLLSTMIVTSSIFGTVYGGNLRATNNNNNNNIGRQLESSTVQKYGGGIKVTFTDQFSLRYNDKGSGARLDGAFYHPNCPNGFLPLGSMGVSNYGDVDGHEWALCIANDDGIDAVTLPTKYEAIYADHGTGAKMDGSLWRPIPPSGYRCLGDVFQRGYDSPSTEEIVCVKEELTEMGHVGGLIWDDHGSGGDQDLSVYKITGASQIFDDSTILIGVNTFTGYASYPTDPNDDPTPVTYNLKLDIPVTRAGDSSYQPNLTSRDQPDETSTSTAVYSFPLPFMLVKDAERNIAYKVKYSPFYNVSRVENYRLQGFDDNWTGANAFHESSTVTQGVTKTQSTTFSESTSIDVSFEGGVEAEGASAKMSVSLTSTMGYSSTRSVSAMKEVSHTVNLDVPAGCAKAQWFEATTMEVRRANGELVGSPLDFNHNNNAYVSSTYCKNGTSVTGTEYLS